MMSAKKGDKIHLRAATYLSPSIPIEYYEMLLQYLEEKLGIYTSLLYESRWEGPHPDRPDPFANNDIDLAWMSSTVYLRLLKSGNKNIELLPISSVHHHRKGEDCPGYFAEVVMHRDLKDKIKEFIDLRGCKWAYNSSESLSGHIMTLQKLKELGENASFFGNILHSGSHLECLKMVLNKKVDAAAVDSNCFALYMDKHLEARKEAVVLESWGMLTPYPFVVNACMPNNLKKQIVDILLHMHQDVEGAKKLAEFRVKRFAKICQTDFENEQQLIEDTKNLSLGSVYY
uniref:Putative phosphite transport system-binding protein PtxB n=1 Tax=Hadrurus spadix TaxID=141984 RepID=A0A1W7R9W8_9SCOR